VAIIQDLDYDRQILEQLSGAWNRNELSLIENERILIVDFRHGGRLSHWLKSLTSAGFPQMQNARGRLSSALTVLQQLLPTYW
jgi:hypothetical protein